MINISEYRRRPRQLADLLPWACLIAPGVVLNKDGSFQATIRFRGPDVETATPHELMSWRAVVHNALKRFGDGYCFHIVALRTQCDLYMPCKFDSLAASLIENERSQSLETAPAYESTQYLTLTYLPPADRTTNVLSYFFTADTDEEVSPASYSGYRDDFIRRMDQLAQLLRGVFPEAKRLDDAETLAFLHDAVSERRLCPAVPDVPFYLDALLTDSPLQAGLNLKLGSKHLRVISIRGYPSTTIPFKLKKLDELPIELRWVARFIPLEKNEAKKLLAKLQRHWNAKRKRAWEIVKEVLTKSESQIHDPESGQKIADIEEALEDLAGDYVTYGYFTLTVTTWAKAAAEVDQNVDAIRNVLDSAGLVSEIESFNALQAYLGGLPGNPYPDVRRPPVSTLNLCDLMPFASVWAGESTNKHLAGPPLIETKTVGSTPFHLSLHCGDVGHTLIVGPTGNGKSTLLNVLSAQWLRYPGAQVFAFDVGGSGQVLTRAVGGEFNVLGDSESSPVFQPLRQIDQENELVWAQDWVIDLATQSEIQLNPIAKDEIWSALQILATRSEQERTLSTLWALVQDESVRQAVYPYTVDGPYGSLLDADTDSLGSNPWQVFELEAIKDRERELIPALTYLFHRLESRFSPDKPTLLIMDEAWTFLDNNTFSRQIREWLKTLRKKNVAVVFSTQTMSDITKSSIAPSIIESCMTRIFLPNASAKDDNIKPYYLDFGLSEAEIERVSSAVKKRDYFYRSTQGSRWFQLGLGDVALSLCGTDWMSDVDAMKRLFSVEPGEDFLRAYLDHVGLTVQAKRLGMTGATHDTEHANA